jgi:hypothetical protein
MTSSADPACGAMSCLVFPQDDTTNRVVKAWTTDIDSTNAVVVSSWGKTKHDIAPHAGSALDVIRGVEVVTFQHDHALDDSDRVKLGVLAETVNDPLAAPITTYPEQYGDGPGVDMMGLLALCVKAIQELDGRP